MMKFSLLTPHKKLVEGETVDEVFAPGVKGTLNILPNHANFATSLETGLIKWHTASGWTTATISQGLLEIFDQKITVLADVSELASDIDLARAKAAKSRAELKIEDGGLDDINFKKYQLKIQRAATRMSAV